LSRLGESPSLLEHDSDDLDPCPARTKAIALVGEDLPSEAIEAVRVLDPRDDWTVADWIAVLAQEYVRLRLGR
jgi:hypothetical protein